MIMNTLTSSNTPLDTSPNQEKTRLSSSRTKTLLPTTFKPHAYSVIIGKGKMPANATGNRRLKILVNMQIENYANAQFKRDKTFIVSRVMRTVKEACPVGAFVKFDGERWWECPDNVSREKIACMFRDNLSSIYRSSNKNKVERRRIKKALQKSKANKLNEKTKTTPSFQKDHSFLISKGISERKAPSDHSFLMSPAPSTSILIPSSSNLIFETLDLVNMFESVDESIFDDIPL